jgi:hypothetical protein
MINMNSALIRVSASGHTEELIQYVLDGLDKNEFDLIDSIDRESGSEDGLAREMVTAAATISVSIAGINAIVRLIEKYLEYKHSETTLRILVDASPDALDKLVPIAEKQSQLILGKALTTVATPDRDKSAE